MSVRVSLSNGENVWVDAELIEVEHRLYQKGRRAFANHLVYLGARAVNPGQVTQLCVEQHPTILNPERLED